MSTNIISRDDLYGFDYREQDRRRADPEERKTYEIKGLWQRHHEIINLAAQGWKQVDIAEILGIDPQTVSNTLNSQLGEAKLSIIRQERDEEAKKNVEKIRILKDKAIKVYHEVFDNIDNQATLKDRMHCADVVMLELSGCRVPTRIHSSSVVLTADELLDFKQRGLAIARESGLIVDTEAKVLNEAGKPEQLTDDAQGA
jgi:predicted transcriptional regulator